MDKLTTAKIVKEGGSGKGECVKIIKKDPIN